MYKDKELERKGKTVLIFALIIIVFLLGFVLWICKDENDHLKILLKQKNSMIEKLAWSDSLLNVYMDVNYDSIQTDTSNIIIRRLKTLSINGQTKTYNELSTYVDSLIYQQEILKDSLWAYKTIVEIVENRYPINSSFTSDGKKMSVESI